MKGTDYLYAAAGIAVLYLAWRAVQAGESVIDAAGEFWGALTFNAEKELGKSPVITPSAAQSEEEWIALGYLERRPDGGTRITPSGEAYIRRKQAELGV